MASDRGHCMVHPVRYDQNCPEGRVVDKQLDRKGQVPLIKLLWQ